MKNFAVSRPKVAVVLGKYSRELLPPPGNTEFVCRFPACSFSSFASSPLLRFVNAACCGDVTHCTDRLVPDSATKLLLDLARLHRFIESRISSFPNCEVIPAGDLLAAKNGTTSEVLAAYANWGAVHGNSAAYTRMALTLVDKVLSGNFKNPVQQQPLFRRRSASSQERRAAAGLCSRWQPRRWKGRVPVQPR